jgi:hypothetical protein
VAVLVVAALVGSAPQPPLTLQGPRGLPEILAQPSAAAEKLRTQTATTPQRKTKSPF